MRRAVWDSRFVLAALLGLALVLVFWERTEGSTNINAAASEHWAWNDTIGWVDYYNTNTVNVLASKMQGYASSSVGDISFDCATTRIGNICAQSNYGVTQDGAGNLSGWGWNDALGWMSFDCHNHNGCAESNYEARIDTVTGIFADYAWNDTVGWMSFNCANHGGCGSSDYKVVTSWRSTSTSGYLDSSVFDTGVAAGAQLNSVLWRGSQPADTSVRFQFAVSNSSAGPWAYRGPDGTGNSFYSAGPSLALPLDYSLFHNYRYFRYRVTLYSNQSQTATPRVDEVIVNWSP